METWEMEDYLMGLVKHDDDLLIKRVVLFSSEGFLNSGFTCKMNDGSEFQITIVQSKLSDNED